MYILRKALGALGKNTDTSYWVSVGDTYLAIGVKWHIFEDGIAVFVASTCETHVLSRELLPFFLGNEALVDLIRSTLTKKDGAMTASSVPSIVKQLHSLKIIDYPIDSSETSI
jgi:hypothetical protein